MIRDLKKHLSAQRTVRVIYLDRAGNFSDRRLKLLSLQGNRLRAYCYRRRAIRSFSVSNILAIETVSYKKQA